MLAHIFIRIYKDCVRNLLIKVITKAVKWWSRNTVKCVIYFYFILIINQFMGQLVSPQTILALEKKHYKTQ